LTTSISVKLPTRNRYEILHWVVIDVLVQIRIGGQRRVGPHQQRITIRRLVMDVKCGERAIGAWTILDNHRLTERGTELVGDDPADRVAGAAGAEHCNEGDRSRRVIASAKRRIEQRG
jgi:hypothetical protein